LRSDWELADPAAKLMRPSALEHLTAALSVYALGHRSERALVCDAGLAIERVQLLNRQIAEVEAELRPLAQQYTPRPGGRLGSHCGGTRRPRWGSRNLRDAHAFAMRSGTAPIPCSSGRNQHIRVNHGGDRELNRLLCPVAMVQLRFPTQAGRQLL